MSDWLASLPLPGAIGFVWPSLLWLLVLMPLLVVGYLFAVRRGAAGSDGRRWHLPMVGEAGKSGAVRRHLPAVLMGLAITSLLVAIARPQAVVVLPGRVESVVLAMDMSGSMRANDIKPTRLAAAQSAAKSFVAEQPRHVRVGVVAVAGTAAVVQSPTHQRDDIVQAIDRLQPQRGTALGAGLIISLATLLPEARIDVERLIDDSRGSARRPPGRPPLVRRGAEGGERNGSGDDAAAGAVRPGSNPSSVLVLLSDGLSNTGPEVATAIDLANEHGVRVYTVGVGTAEGASVSADGWSMRVKLDEDGLRKIASATGAEYFAAGNADEIKRIYRHVGAKIALQKQARTEVTSLLVGLGALFACVAGLLSMAWFNRVL